MRSIAVRGALFVLFAVAAAVAVTHMNSLPAFIVIAPGYVVQAWLFETHRGNDGRGVRSRVDADHPRPGPDRPVAATPRDITSIGPGGDATM